MKTTFYAEHNGVLVVLGKGDYAPIQKGSIVAFHEVDPLTHLRVELGEFHIDRTVLTLSGYRAGPKAVWQATGSGARSMLVYATPLDEAAKKYVAFCHEHQVPAAPGP